MFLYSCPLRLIRVTFYTYLDDSVACGYSHSLFLDRTGCVWVCGNNGKQLKRCTICFVHHGTRWRIIESILCKKPCTFPKCGLFSCFFRLYASPFLSPILPIPLVIIVWFSPDRKYLKEGKNAWFNLILWFSPDVSILWREESMPNHWFSDFHQAEVHFQEQQKK